ncbi:hypothetical protein RHSIM_Rhsim05G0014200 [Rhododendron simsii]|uniref:Late embryogenesis abundant protein LEA-2 subgroup domain-containing protein n=1 Tax=Rhododendron simsii TaxID=118357 RepID=A0A834H1D9_RHOSS|nr:hypothetical protein RHSIM_Rhsim05G0014200 [Rhododendron simsii]
MCPEPKPFPDVRHTRRRREVNTRRIDTPTDATNIVAKPKSDPCEVCVIRGIAIYAVLNLAVLIYAIVLGGDAYSPDIRVQTAYLSLDHDVSSSRISTAGEVTFNLSITFFSPSFDNATEVSVFYRKELLSKTVTDSFPRDTACSCPCDGTVRERTAKAVFPRSSVDVGTRVSDKMAGDLNSSSPVVEFSFVVNARGSLRKPGDPEDERRGFNMTIRCPGVKLEFDAKTRVGMMAGQPPECKVSTTVEYKAQYDDPPKRSRDWDNLGSYRLRHF